jgi:23S rRNA pseudoU1915 N3-methylase RlmH
MKLCISFLLLSAAFAVSAQPLPDYSFKSPSFNGIGYSSHVLTIENQEHTRKETLKKDIQAALDKAANDAKNTNLAKFLNNLESRIYAQISQNVATAMFATGGSDHGNINFEGSVISWQKNGTDSITLTVVDPTGSTTTIQVPLGQFVFQ